MSDCVHFRLGAWALVPLQSAAARRVAVCTLELGCWRCQMCGRALWSGASYAWLVSLDCWCMRARQHISAMLELLWHLVAQRFCAVNDCCQLVTLLLRCHLRTLLSNSKSLLVHSVPGTMVFDSLSSPKTERNNDSLTVGFLLKGVSGHFLGLCFVHDLLSGGLILCFALHVFCFHPFSPLSPLVFLATCSFDHNTRSEGKNTRRFGVWPCVRFRAWVLAPLEGAAKCRCNVLHTIHFFCYLGSMLVWMRVTRLEPYVATLSWGVYLMTC